MVEKSYKSVIEMCEDMSSPEFTLELAKSIIKRKNEDYKTLHELASKMAGALEECVPEIDDGDWWCPLCQQALSWSSVTNTEHCDTCGTYLSDCQPDPKKLNGYRDIISKAKEFRDTEGGGE